MFNFSSDLVFEDSFVKVVNSSDNIVVFEDYYTTLKLSAVLDYFDSFSKIRLTCYDKLVSVSDEGRNYIPYICIYVEI